MAVQLMRGAAYQVFFDAELLCIFFRMNPRQCLEALGLRQCDDGGCAYLKEELHGHVPASAFDPRPRGDPPFWVARLGSLEISYHFDSEHLEPPPIYFVSIPIFEPASKE